MLTIICQRLVFLFSYCFCLLSVPVFYGGSMGYAYAFALFVEGYYGTLPPGGYYSTYGAYALKEGLKNAFEPNDARYINWVGVKTINSDVWYYSHKYKKSGFNASSSSLPNEDFVLLRLAEQYLIRAEARAQQDNISGAQEDVNVIRTRAGLANTTATAKEALLEAVAQERRIELMVEGGHRWYDLKRTGKIDQVLSPLKADWQSTDALFPIPLQEILNNDNLTQNPGY